MSFNQTSPTHDWEAMWAPYDEPTYSAVLQELNPDDVVLDIGAGDLRLAWRMAKCARKVYAIERNPVLLIDHTDLPGNCHLMNADARRIPFPSDISVAVLLMRHCTTLPQYWVKLTAAGCKKLITNARWGMGVEIIDLTEERLPFEMVHIGWYACNCGGTGFMPGDGAQVTGRVLEKIWEVEGCPAC